MQNVHLKLQLKHRTLQNNNHHCFKHNCTATTCRCCFL